MVEREYGYSIWESPAGWLAAVAGEESLVSILFRPQRADIDRLLAVQYPHAEALSRGVAPLAMAQLKEYFSAGRKGFDLPLDLRGCSRFAVSVLAALQEVPYGATVSYGELARMAGAPRAARAIGRVMASNPLPLVIPCHRVVGSGGQLTGYSGGSGVRSKRWLLEFERRHSSS